MSASRKWQAGLALLGLSILMLVGGRPFALQAQGASTHTVCPSGCDFSQIQAAITAADPGDTVNLLFLTPHVENEIVIDRDLTITGLGPMTTIVQAAASPGSAGKRVFFVAAGHTVELRDFTIRHGDVSGSGGGLYNAGSDVTLDGVHVLVNTATMSGAGLYNAAGTMTLRNIQAASNTSSGDGGGIYNADALFINNSYIYFNNASGSGAGLYNSGQAVIRGGDFQINKVLNSGDTLHSGGAIYSSGPLQVFSSYFAGNSVGAGTAAGTIQGGGAIFVRETEFTLMDSVITTNLVNDHKNGAGLLLFDSQSTISGSTIRDNTASGNGNSGGGILVHSGTLQMDTTTIHGNESDQEAGGIMIFDTDSAVISSSTIDGNKSEQAAGLYACGEGGTQALRNVTISGNEARGDGGGIYLCAGGALELSNVTVSQNEADADGVNGGSGGGIYMHTIGDHSGTLNTRNSLIAGNKHVKPLLAQRSPDCYGELTSLGYNLIGTLGTALVGDLPCSVVGDDTGNLYGADTFMGPLADYGGPTETHALGPLSEAINAGNPAGCMDETGTPLTADQRGGLRPNRCDIGAYEVGALLLKAQLPAVLAP